MPPHLSLSFPLIHLPFSSSHTPAIYFLPHRCPSSSFTCTCPCPFYPHTQPCPSYSRTNSFPFFSPNTYFPSYPHFYVLVPLANTAILALVTRLTPTSTHSNTSNPCPALPAPNPAISVHTPIPPIHTPTSANTSLSPLHIYWCGGVEMKLSE